MADDKPTSVYFTSVVAFSPELAVLGGHLRAEGTEPSVTRFYVVSGDRWGFLEDMDEIVYAATRKDDASGAPTLCRMGRRGLYRETPFGGATHEVRLAVDPGYLLDLRSIGGALHACGTQNQVHRQVAGGWHRIDAGTFAPLGPAGVDRSFEAIDGLAADDLYAVGQSGAVWHFDGRAWTALERPTTYPLFAVLCASSGDVFVAGSNGTLFRGGRGRGWTPLGDPALTRATLVDLAELQGKVYIAGGAALLTIEGDSLARVEVPLAGPLAFDALDVDRDRRSLWSVGDGCVLRCTGARWDRLECPDN